MVVVNPSADRLEEKAIKKNPSKYNPRNPWPKVDEYVKKNTPIELQPSTDFSPHKAALRSEAIRLDRRDTIRELRRKGERVSKSQEDYIEKSKDPLSPEFYTPGGNEKVNYLVNDFADRANDLANLERDRVASRDISAYQGTKNIIEQARAANVQLTSEDIENAVQWGVLNAAADRIIAAYNAGDVVDSRNVLLTLQKGNFIEASLLPEIINDKLIESIEDPALMENVSNGIMAGLGYAIQPFVTANEYVMQGSRSYVYEGAQQGQRVNVLLNVPSSLKAFFSGSDRERVAPGQFDQDYIQMIRDSGEYSEIELDYVIEVVRRASIGDAEALTSTYADKFLDNPEAAKIYKDLMYNRSNPKVQELFRQVTSASLGDTGQVLISLGLTPEGYDPNRGSETRQDIANITGFAYSFIADPTLLAAKAFRLVQAVKWGLTDLAPGAVPASRVIKQIKLGKLSFDSRPYRFFDNLTKDLNKIDELDEAAKVAEGSQKTKIAAERDALRNAMSRQYGDMPEDLIDDFHKYMPKNADGKFDVESAVKYIDESNEAIIVQAGKISEDLASQGASLEARRAAVQNILNEKSFARRVASKNQRRTAYVPTMGLVTELRKNTVNKIISYSMPLNKSIKIVDEYIDNAADAKDFARGFSDSATEIGKAVRTQKFTTIGGLYDAAGRLFSSVNVKRFVSVSTADDAQNVYRYARSFFPRRTAQMIANSYRNGTEGSRRLLLSGVVRSAAASRGITLTAEEADSWIKGLSKTEKDFVSKIGKLGEQYGVKVPTGRLPSEVAKNPVLVDDLVEDGAPLIQKSLSADSNGIEHALHLNQTASNVALPSIKDFEILRDQIKMGIIPTGKWRNNLGTAAQKATDYWSVGTLFGFRFSLRNAIEETGIYWLIGGRALDFYKGRKASQAIRTIRPRVYVKVDADKNVLYNKEGVPQLVYKSSLGMFASKKEWLKRQLTSNKSTEEFFEEWSKHNGFRHWFADLILPATRPSDSLIAMQEFARGNPDAFAELAIKSLAAQKRGLNLNAMSEADEEAYAYLVNSTHGMALLDEIAEAAPYLNSGNFPMFMDEVNGILDEIPAGVGFGKPKYVSEKMGDYGNVLLDSSAGRNLYASSMWWRVLQMVVDGDGAIGEVAVKAIRDFSRGSIDSATAKSLIAKTIRDDNTYGYVEKFSRITDDASIDDFADSYFENTLQHFTRADGSINDDLVSMFVDKDGNWLGWWEDLGEGAASPRISKDTLTKMFPKLADRPKYVFGREIDKTPYVPIAETLPAFWSINRAYGWMGAQNARISREPVFLSNYFRIYGESQPAREGFAKAMARSRGGEVTETDTLIANAVYAEQSLDDAFNLTISFVDNPANRSNLAWKSRNIARYYRASEDFYRRLKRMALKSPESFWKGALTYNLAQDSGFVFKDDNGDSYFTYPGNEILQDATTFVASKWFGIDMKDFSNIEPFLIGGRLLGVAPSSDPDQFVPSFSGPLSSASLVTLFNAFPALGGLRAATLGTYSQPSGSYLNDLINSVLPAGALKAGKILDPEQVDTTLAGSGIDTIALMMAEGNLDELTITVDGKKRFIDGDSATYAEFIKTDQYKASQAISVGLFVSKFIISLFGAAAPRVYSNTVSEEARGLGIDSIKDAQRDLSDVLFDPKFIEFVEENSTSSDPFSAALSVWFGMKGKEIVDGEYSSLSSMLPFTLSSYKTPEDNPLIPLSGIQISRDLINWTETDFAKDLDKQGFGDVRYFLAPKVGEFDFPAWQIGKVVLGLKVPKTEEERIEELFAMRGKANDNAIRLHYQKQIDLETDKEVIKNLKKEESFLRDANRAENKSWDTVKGSSGIYTESNFRLALTRTRDMLDYIKERDGELTGDAASINAGINVYLYYSSQMSGLQGQSKAVKAEKERINAEMELMFSSIRQDSSNAAFFIDSILSELSYKEIYGDTFGER